MYDLCTPVSNIHVPVGSDEYMLSKTVEFGRSMNIDDVDLGQPATGWSKWDEKYFIPFFR